MSIIIKIITDFHDCTNLPIQFLDEALTPIATAGLMSNVPQFTTDNLKPNRTKTFTTAGTGINSARYIVLPFNETSHQKGFFLIGPSEKPEHLTEHFEELLIAIVKRNIANTTIDNPHIAKGIKYIHEHFAEAINLMQLCDYLGLNNCYFCVLFKNQTGMTFSQYLNRVRITQSKKLLETTTDSIIDISLAVGFNNHNHFSATFKKLTSVTPTEYRNKVKS